MSGDPLYVQPDGVRSYAQIHGEVVAELSGVMGTAAAQAAGVQTSHGAIASAVSTALVTGADELTSAEVLAWAAGVAPLLEVPE